MSDTVTSPMNTSMTTPMNISMASPMSTTVTTPINTSMTSPMNIPTTTPTAMDMVFDYNSFIRRMKHPDCQALITAIKQFIRQFRRRAAVEAPITQQVQFYRDFMERIMMAVRENPVWRLVGEANSREYEMAREGLEYLLMNQLYPWAFNPAGSAGAEDREHDAHLQRKIVMFASWVQPKHLDIPASLLSEITAIDLARQEWQRIGEYYTPRDKLICLLNGSRILQTMVEAASVTAGADELMPVLIYALLGARLDQLYSNLQFISRFRCPRELASSPAYHFTCILAATTFIERLDVTSLVGVTSEEYDNYMECAVMQLNAETVLATEEGQAKAKSARESEGMSDEMIARQSQTKQNQSRINTSHSNSPPQSHCNSASELRHQFSSPDSPHPNTPSFSFAHQQSGQSSVRLREEATRLFETVKERVKLGASKSIDYLGKFIDEAEAAVRATIRSGSNSPPPPVNDRAMVEEDEFQLQLAMALSLSEQQDYLPKTTDTTHANNMEASPSQQDTMHAPLLDLQDSTNSHSSNEKS